MALLGLGGKAVVPVRASACCMKAWCVWCLGWKGYCGGGVEGRGEAEEMGGQGPSRRGL